MSTISNISPSAPQGGQNPEDLNAFYLVLMATLNSISANQEGINGVIEKEKVLKALFEAQNAVVADAKELLKELSNAKLDPNDIAGMQTQLGKINAQNMTVQAEQQKLNIIQNEMAQCFGRYAEPEQKAILNGCMIASGAISNLVATRRVR
jgi:hypothetical protein